MDDRDENDFDKLLKSTFGDMNKIFEGMDSIFKTFISDSENNTNHFPNLFRLPNNDEKIDSNNNGSLRDQYIKKNDDNLDHTNQTPSLFQSPKQFFSFQAPPFVPPRQNFDNSIENFDEDLDNKFKKNDDKLNVYSKPSFQVQSKSVSVRRIQRPDGTIEEVTTTRDSSGKEETRVTRIIGDKSHSFINRKSTDGSANETEEIFNNFDESSIADFNKTWNDNKINHSPFRFAPILNNPQIPKKEEEEHNPQASNLNNKSILSKLYSWWNK